MKSKMRWSTSALAVALMALILAACGDEPDAPAITAEQAALKVLEPLLVPEVKAPEDDEAPPAAPDEEPAPSPAEPAPSPAEPADEAPADDEGMGEVRETGFATGPDDDEAEAPADDEGMGEVRETGFVPPPILELVEVADDVAHLRWGAVPTIEHYRISGTRFGSDGEAVESFEIDTGYTQHALPLGGLRTVVGVTALDDAGKARSKRSETIDIPGQ